MKYRALFITSNYPLLKKEIENGGRGSFFIPLIARLTSENYSITVLTPNRVSASFSKEGMDGTVGEKIYAFDSNLKDFNSLSYFNPIDLIKVASFMKSYWKALNMCLMREKQFDLVILAWGIPTGLLLLNSKIRTLPNAIWWLGTDYNKFNTFLGRPLLRIISNLTNINFFNSKNMMNTFKENINKNVQFAPLMNIDNVELNKYEKKESKVFRILSIGNLVKVKGFDLAIDAVTALIDSGYNLEYNIIGEGPEKKYLNKKISSYRNRVRIIGRIKEQEKINMLQNCEIFLISSRSEGMPIVFFEALSQNKIICATRVGDIEEILKDTSIGSIIHQKTKKGIADAIKLLINKPIKFSNKDKENIFKDYSIIKTLDLIKRMMIKIN